MHRPIKSGSPDAEFTAMYRAHYPAVLAFLRRRVPAEHAEDLAADTFHRAWKSFAAKQGADLPWLYGIARNTMKESYRAASVRPQSAGEEGIEDAEAADFSTVVDMSLDINQALLKLNSAERDVLTLHVWEGLTTAELAEALNITPANARVRLHRARTHLAQALEKP